MKTTKFLSVFFLLAGALSLTSCNSDDSNEPVTPPSTGTFTVTMDGEAFIATQSQAVVTNGVMAIGGTRGTNGETIALMVQATTPGTYQGSVMTYITEIDGVEYMNVNPGTVQQNGTVTISSIQNDIVTGTFSFTAYNLENGQDSIEFTEGSFSVPLTVTNPPVGQGGVTAFINGAQVNYATALVGFGNEDYSLSAMNMSNMQMIQINMGGSIAPGTYPIGGIFDGGNYAMIGSSTGNIESVQGSFTITSNSNGWLIGTFSFTGEDFDGNQVQVTGGQFNAQIAE